MGKKKERGRKKDRERERERERESVPLVQGLGFKVWGCKISSIRPVLKHGL